MSAEAALPERKDVRRPNIEQWRMQVIQTQKITGRNDARDVRNRQESYSTSVQKNQAKKCE